MNSRTMQKLVVHLARDLSVVDGANLGDSLSFYDELQPDDVYHLRENAGHCEMLVRQIGPRKMQVTEASSIGRPCADLHVDCCVTFMANNGQTICVIVLVELDEDGYVAEVYGLPLGQLRAQTDYRIIGIDSETPERRYAEVACVSFASGTKITMATGVQKPVEMLCEGDEVLTRDDGVQPLRWIGQSTMRATGEGAPIRITAGALNNSNDLHVGPDLRLFIYQRSDRLGTGRSEALVRARHLVNGDTVRRVEGGFVDYYQLVFDAHQIIFAEGIAAETLLVDTRTRAALPRSLNKALSTAVSAHHNRLRDEFELSESIVRQHNVVELLRRASSR